MSWAVDVAYIGKLRNGYKMFNYETLREENVLDIQAWIG
jgi:hypothetical protein